MKINKDQFHTKWFLFWHEFVNRWFEDPCSHDLESPTRTNVCSYIRTTVVWPLYFLFVFSAFFTLVTYFLIAHPISVFGVVGYLAMMTSIFSVAGFVFSLAFWLNKTQSGELFKERRKELKRLREKDEDKKTSWFGMFFQWISDRHDKICTMVEIEEDKND